MSRKSKNKGRFLDKIIVWPMSDGVNWELQHEVRYVTKDGRVIYIPAGFVTDFASIPWFFRRLFQPATGKHRDGAVVHDWIFRTADCPFTFEEANDIFNDIMVLRNTTNWKRALIYKGVQLGGRSSFVERA